MALRKFSIIVLLLLAAGGWWWSSHPAQPVAVPTAAQAPASIAELPATRVPQPSRPPLPGFLPPEARDTLRLIATDGPYPHRQDGGVFGNREGRLPGRPRGYYREFTVETPRLDHRGARRIITGGRPPETCYYTGDHYESFRQFDCALDGSRR